MSEDIEYIDCEEIAATITAETRPTSEEAAEEISEAVEQDPTQFTQEQILDLVSRGMQRGAKDAWEAPKKKLSMKERRIYDNKLAAEQNKIAKRRAKDKLAAAARKKNRK